MTEAQTRAIERLVGIADRIEQFQEETQKTKMIPLSMLRELRMARKQVKSACGI